MPAILATRDPGFETAFRKLLTAKRESAADVDAAVAAIIDDLAARGDAALIEYTKRFDRVALTPASLRLSDQEIVEMAARAPAKTGGAALFSGADRILPPAAISPGNRLHRLGWRP